MAVALAATARNRASRFYLPDAFVFHVEWGAEKVKKIRKHINETEFLLFEVTCKMSTPKQIDNLLVTSTRKIEL